MKLWIRNAQPRLATSDTTSRGLESQLGRNQVKITIEKSRKRESNNGFVKVLQNEIREMQITINRLNKDVVDLTQDADESLTRRLRDEMQQLNESWSHIISSTKVYSQNIQVSITSLIHSEVNLLFSIFVIFRILLNEIEYFKTTFVN